MKNYFKTLLPLAGLVLLASPVVRAEDPAGPPPPPPPGEHREHREDMKEMGKKMAKELNLTAEQEIQVEAIHKQTREAMKAIRNDAALTEDQKKAKGRELRKSTEAQVDALLTPEQLAKAKAMRAKHGPHGPGERPPGDSAPAGVVPPAK